MISRLRRSGTAIGIVAGLMMISGLALASEHEEPEHDTLLVVGYDAINGILVTGISDALSSAWDCSVPAPEDPEADPLTFEVTYGDQDTEGKVPTQDVQTLTQDGDVVEFAPNEDAAEPAEDPAEYPDAEECRLTGTSVAGKKGQINHGKVVSAFSKLVKSFEGKKGCLMRLIAHTEFGKDYQVKPSDLDPEADPVVAATGTLTLENMAAKCQKGNKENKGQLKKAERLAEGTAPGNSGNAKGKNKDR